MRVSVVADHAAVKVAIDDDGQGFDTSDTRSMLFSGRLGLATLNQRVESIGGRCMMQSQPGHGSLLVVELPPMPRKEVAA